MEAIKKQLDAQTSGKCVYPRLKFISNFYLYHGLTTFYQKQIDNNERPSSDLEHLQM